MRRLHVAVRGHRVRKLLETEGGQAADMPRMGIRTRFCTFVSVLVGRAGRMRAGTAQPQQAVAGDDRKAFAARQAVSRCRWDFTSAGSLCLKPLEGAWWEGGGKAPVGPEALRFWQLGSWQLAAGS